MTKQQDYRSRMYFIEGVIDRLLKVKPDFDSVKYRRTGLTEAEYVRITDVQGKAVTLDVTARSLEAIAEDVARIILLDREKIAPPDNVVTDKIILRSIAPLFK